LNRDHKFNGNIKDMGVGDVEKENLNYEFEGDLVINLKTTIKRKA